MLTAVVIALLGAPALSFRMTRVRSKQNEQTASRYIESVPVFEIDSEKVPGKVLKDEWVVFMKVGRNNSHIEALCDQADCKAMGHPSSGGISFAAVRASEEVLASALRGNTDVQFVTPDYALEPDLDPSPEDARKAEEAARSGGIGTASSALEWNLHRVGVPTARETGRGVHVYVFDSGVDVTNDEFRRRSGKTIPTADFDRVGGKVVACDPMNTSCAADYVGHGTHVAGTVGGHIYGVAKDATIHAMNMYFGTADRGVSVAYAVFDWLILNHEKPAVLQMSFGWPSQVPGSDVAVKALLAADITVVAAAGNSNSPTCEFTWGWIPGVIAVAASDVRDVSAIFTNHGPCTTLYAPGVSITSANWVGGVTQKSGTSMAAPLVSGVVALLLEKNPALKPSAVKDILVQAAEKDALTSVPSGTPNLLLRVVRGGAPAPTAPPPAPRKCSFWCGFRLCWAAMCKRNCAFCQA